LACSGAMRVGAGLVMLATPQSLQPVLASKLTETTYLPLPESRPGIISSGAADVILDQIGGYQVILVGCGLGQSPGAIELVETLLGEKGLPPVVIDADALNIMSKIPDWQRKLRGDAVLTPHPGEMARLTGISIDKIQADRTGIVKKFALEWQKTIVLKGAFTVIASQDGRCRVSPFANPGMASAGTGDVLGGVIAGLAAQGLELLEAASLGVYLHGEAGEIVRGILGDAGMVASDLLSALPVVIKGLKEKDRG
ncbi:MAG: NAD(P)H-hydrate dehydratase, partial [Chloroflexi bacterium RBG_16_50_11]